METPGELYDKISILKIRAGKHPNPAVRMALRHRRYLLESEVHLLRERIKCRLLEPNALQWAQHKIRARVAEVPMGTTVCELQTRLECVNQQMWNNEDIRDALVTAGEPTMELLEADRTEQQLNQDRNALIDAINQTAAVEWLKCV